MVFGKMTFLLRTHNTDPGVLPRNTEEYSEKIKAVARYDKWEDGEENPLSRLCHTCRCVKVISAISSLKAFFLHRSDGKTRMLDNVSASFDQTERA